MGGIKKIKNLSTNKKKYVILGADTTKKEVIKMTLQEKIQKLYTELQGANIKEYTNQKNTGRNVLDYLSWGAAIDFFTKGCHTLGLDWTYSHNFVDMGARGSFVETTITILDSENGDTVEKVMALPCMTVSNQAAKDVDVMIINKTQMRCLVKCMTLFGLGLSLYLKDFSELNDVKMASETKADEQSKKLAMMKERIKALLDDIDPTVDTSAYERYKDSESIDELTAIGIAVKKLHDTQGAN